MQQQNYTKRSKSAIRVVADVVLKKVTKVPTITTATTATATKWVTLYKIHITVNRESRTIIIHSFRLFSRLSTRETFENLVGRERRNTSTSSTACCYHHHHSFVRLTAYLCR
ncbi:hypothetical protein ABEB36_002164 [Hypothenemus hampei]|uniref:Uncharacterized protein n=1 Tax=Hypothenemus hampei TaxID=57062 RepID=A0ABD1F4T1_HYPHA